MNIAPAPRTGKSETPLIVFPFAVPTPRAVRSYARPPIRAYGAAFGAIQDALSFFRNSYDTFAGWRASIIRLYGLVTADEQSRELPKLAITDTDDGVVEIDAVEVRSPAGVSDGSRCRVAGEGGRGSGSSQSGVLSLRVQLKPHPVLDV